MKMLKPINNFNLKTEQLEQLQCICAFCCKIIFSKLRNKIKVFNIDDVYIRGKILSNENLRKFSVVDQMPVD